MDPWGRESTQTVSSLRQATDPVFLEALETDQRLQELYLGGVELRPKTNARLDQQEVIRLDEANVANAASVSAHDSSLTVSTTGGATIRLIAGDWDPETKHVLTMRIVPAPVTPEPPGEWIEVIFSGDLPIPYPLNTDIVPKWGTIISINLLRLS